MSGLNHPTRSATYTQRQAIPIALPVIDISAPVCCAPVAAGPVSENDAVRVWRSG